MLLDEFCNIGVIDNFTLKISTIRSRGIVSVVIVQDIPQIMNRYPEGLWEEIIAACDTLIYLGGNDNTTGKYISSLTGEATISIKNRGLRYDINATVSTDSNSTNKRLVYTIGEVLSLHPDHQLVRIRGKQILECLKYDYSNHPDTKYIVRTNVNNHTPIRTHHISSVNNNDIPIEKNSNTQNKPKTSIYVPESSDVLKYPTQQMTEFHNPFKNNDRNTSNIFGCF